MNVYPQSPPNAPCSRRICLENVVQSLSITWPQGLSCKGCWTGWHIWGRNDRRHLETRRNRKPLHQDLRHPPAKPPLHGVPSLHRRNRCMVAYEARNQARDNGRAAQPCRSNHTAPWRPCRAAQILAGKDKTAIPADHQPKRCADLGQKHRRHRRL